MAVVKLDIFRSNVPGSMIIVGNQVTAAIEVKVVVAGVDSPEVVDRGSKEVWEANVVGKRCKLCWRGTSRNGRITR